MVMMRATPDEDLFVLPEEASIGSQVGVLEGITQAWAYGNLIESQIGVSADLISQERENEQKIIQAGGKPPKSAFSQDSLLGTSTIKAADELATILSKNDRRAYDEKYSSYERSEERL